MKLNHNSLTSLKWVRIMCDFSATGVWDKDGCSCALEELPVTPIVKIMIEGWQAWYECSIGCAETKWFDPKAHAAFGLFVARLVKSDLPEWTVIYFDESSAEGETLQYEIILSD